MADSKNPTIGTIACEYCGATVDVRLTAAAKPRAYYRCRGQHGLTACGRWVTMGHNETAEIRKTLEGEGNAPLEKPDGGGTAEAGQGAGAEPKREQRRDGWGFGDW